MIVTSFWNTFNDLVICDNVNQRYKQLCYKEIATNVLNIDICDNLNDEVSGVNCKDWVWKTLAWFKLDSLLCDNLSNEGSIESCKGIVYSN